MEINGLLIIIILVSISLSFLLKRIFFEPSRLPPGPARFPVVGNVIWLKKNTFSEFQNVLRDLTARLGPIVTLHVGSKPSVWVCDHSLAHQALVQKGAIFADRPEALPTTRVITSNQHDIHSAGYGPLWRALRRNLTAEMLHASRVGSHGHARRWALYVLTERLRAEQKEAGLVSDALGHFRHSMFCLLALMCFGQKLSTEEIKGIEEVQSLMLMSYAKFGVLNIFPSVTKFLLRKKWEEFLKLRKHQEDVLIPFIRAREKLKEGDGSNDSSENNDFLCYVDTLLRLELPEDKRRLTEGEMVSLCSEFLNAGTDPTATAMQWIMANLIKHPRIQEKLYREIEDALGEDKDKEEIDEDDLSKVPYLKAVVLEGLRRHPPGHYLAYHRATEDTTLGGYSVPRNGTINFMVAEMGRDPKVWEEPMEFRPERFLGTEGIDITGSREIKMMPFGAGRRICPGYGAAILYLEYFIANLVWRFQWKAAEGEGVDLNEKQQFITMVMTNPFRAHVSLRKDVEGGEKCCV